MFKIYEGHYPLLEEEKCLLFCLISIPDKLEFNEKEYSMCKKVRKFYDYMDATDRLISDYIPMGNESML